MSGNDPKFDQSSLSKQASQNIETLQVTLAALKMRLEKGQKLSIEELEALNKALAAAIVVGAAW